jgi:hypothetical protein
VSISYIPAPGLSLTNLLKACKRAGIEFSCPTEQLEKIIENFNLVIHLGFKLNTSLLWYSYFIITNLKIIVDGATQEERKMNLKEKANSLFKDLINQNLVQDIKESQYFKEAGINILWR